MSHIEKIEHAGLLILFYYDEDAESPDQWGNEECFLTEISTRHYRLGRKGVKYIPSDGEDEDNDPDYEPVQSGFEPFPVELVDYGGANGCQLRFCAADEASGAILVNQFPELERLARGVTSKDEAEGMLGEWNTYLRGDVWGYRIIRPDKCESCGQDDHEELDSLWGIYEYSEAVQMAKDAAEHHAKSVA
jgi:hypothetical protein